MGDINANDAGYSVYLLYQKEVYSSDHSFLQSMMDWLYTSNDSPLKFYFRNKSHVNITHNGILIRKDNSLTASSHTEQSNWSQIYFNFKHLKEIYVDKRHKDTCVLVSKVSSSTSANYVWKKTNPSNYQSFRTAYSLNQAYKKTFLLTILKFKDGPSRLLQTIQLLDSVLVDYNKKEDLINKSLKSNPELSNIIYNTLSNKTTDTLKNIKKTDLTQIYSNFVKSTSRHSIDNMQAKVQKNSSNLSLNQYEASPASRLRNRSQQIIGQKMPRNHSVDNRVPNKTLYANLNNSSNTSLQSFQSNNFYYRQVNSTNVSRQSSVNDLRPQNAPLLMNRGYLANNFLDPVSPVQSNFMMSQINKSATLPADNKKLYVKQSQLSSTSINLLKKEEAAATDTGKNIKIKLVNDVVNFENNISESSENDEFESTNQMETVIERKLEPDDDMTKNDYDDTTTNTILEDLSLNNNTETINDSNLDTMNNYDFTSSAKNLVKIEPMQQQKMSQNIYYNFLKDDYSNLSTNLSSSITNITNIANNISKHQHQQQQQQHHHHLQHQQQQHVLQSSQMRPALNQSKIASLVRNASISSTSGINDDKTQESKESNLKVRDIINSFNNLNNLNNKKTEVIAPMQVQVKNVVMPNNNNNNNNNNNSINNSINNAINNSINNAINNSINNSINNHNHNNNNNNNNKIGSVTVNVGNRVPPPVKLIQNDYSSSSYKKSSNITLNKSPTQLGGSPKHISESPSLTLNVNTMDSLNVVNQYYQNSYFNNRPVKLESPVKINNDINIINNKLARIVNLLTNSSEQLNEQAKKLDIEVTNSQAYSTQSTEEYSNQAKLVTTVTTHTHPPVATVAPITQKKRTFANMIWPMDPEEEKILRSTSPFVVPEIIVQKPERVKSILKKSNGYLSTSVSGFDLASCANHPLTQSSALLGNYPTSNTVTQGIVQSASSTAANKKRVDFHENFCYINFFDTHEEN